MAAIILSRQVQQPADFQLSNDSQDQFDLIIGDKLKISAAWQSWIRRLVDQYFRHCLSA